MKLIPRIPFSYPEIALLILRVSVGAVFVFHGSGKLFGPGGVDGFAQYLVQLGVPSPTINAWLTALAEFLGGLALIFGVYARWATLPLIFVMLVAILTATGPRGFSLANDGWEYNFVLIAALCTIFLSRAEKWQIKQ